MGIPETVSLLMKADCSLIMDRLMPWNDHFARAIEAFCGVQHYTAWLVSQEAHTDVLDTFISSLAERRRNLQGRLAALSAAVTINPKVFQDDRILDEYAQYAECVEEDAIRGNDHMPRHASSLVPHYRTVYHVKYLTVEAAEKLWQNGFRDIDVPDDWGLTPLMCRYTYDLVPEIELYSWLIRKGAKLHRLQHDPLDCDTDLTISAVELPPAVRALHYVAYNIGRSAYCLVRDEQSAPEERRLQTELHRLSKEARLLATTIFLDISCDDCVCACSSQGCLPCTMMLKSFMESAILAAVKRTWLYLATKFLIDLVGPNDPCPDWLFKEIIRFQTFTELELRHTCCEWHYRSAFTRRDLAEQAEIRDEDHEKIELLENLLREFEEHRGIQDVLSFLEGYWAMRMDQVHRERGHVDKDALRKIGVVLHEEDEGGSDEESDDGDD